MFLYCFYVTGYIKGIYKTLQNIAFNKNILLRKKSEKVVSEKVTDLKLRDYLRIEREVTATTAERKQVGIHDK